MTAYFVTGAGTEIGKTYIAAALLAAKRAGGARVHGLKPLMSGFDETGLDASDAGVLLSACGETPTADAIARICLYQFEAPLAPNVAARGVGVEIDDAALFDFLNAGLADRARFTLVEGAGGVMSPASDQLTQIDLMERLKLPVIFVTGAYLGAISHTLTGLEALDRRGLKTAAIVVSQPSADASAPAPFIEELKRWRKEPMLAAPFDAKSERLGENLARLLV